MHMQHIKAHTHSLSTHRNTYTKFTEAVYAFLKRRFIFTKFTHSIFISRTSITVSWGIILHFYQTNASNHMG